MQEAQKYDLEFKRRTDNYKPDDYEKLVQKLPDIDETGAKGRITKEDVNKARNVVQGGLKAIVGE